MIRITRQTDYGILLLSQLATRPPSEVHTAKDVARQSKISLPMVSKTLKALARGGLLVSQRGVKGGYRLSTQASRISIGNVIEALEGPIGMTECSFNPGACEQEGKCPVQANWQRISVAVRDALEKIPISELSRPRVLHPDLHLIDPSAETARPL